MIKILDIHSHLKIDKENAETIYSFSGIPTPSSFKGYKSIGIHPWDLDKPQTSWAEIESLAQDTNTLAIGETGLDKTIATPLNKQEELFIKHIALSEKYCKPLIIHSVKTTPEILKLHKQLKPKQAWIIHGFRGKPELYQEYNREGIRVSIGEKFNIHTLQCIPLNQLLLETDDSNKDIYALIETIASIKNITSTQLINQIYDNSSLLFFRGCCLF